jgi:ATP-binding cassette subfamily B protein
MKSMARLFSMAGDYKNRMIRSVLLATLSVIFGIVPFFIIYNIVLGIMNKSLQFGAISKLAIIAGICLILKVVLFSRATILSHGVAYRILYTIRASLANKFADLPLGYLNDRASGGLKKIMVDDVEKLEQFLAHNIPETMSNLIVPLVITIYMFMLDWRMALALLSTIPLSYVAFIFMMKDYNVKMKKMMQVTEHMNSTIVEYIEGMEVIKAFNQTTKSFGKYSSSLKTYKDYVMDWFRSCWPYMAVYFVVMTANIIVVLPVGGYFYINGSLDLGTYILFMLIALGFSAPLLKLTEFIDGIAMIVACEQSVNEVLEEAGLYKCEDEQIPKNYDIQFIDVRFSYKTAEVLKNITFKAESGTTTALVGPSGSGKSTIAKLIARFWDVNSGEITIGDVNIKEVPIEKLMNMMSFVFQDVYLFNNSIIENIRLGRKDATDEEVIEAAKKAMCHEFIMKTENGYDTIVGDGGNRLSGGEKQRVSIARAILRDAPIIILDEATAFTDPENEDKIQESLNNLTKNKTLIVIAHRLSTIMYSEKILVIDEGEIVADGTHDELLKSSKLYSNMWNAHIGAMDWQFNIEGGAC